MALSIKSKAVRTVCGYGKSAGGPKGKLSMLPTVTGIALAGSLWVTATLAIINGLSGATLPVSVAPGHALPRPEIAAVVGAIKNPSASDRPDISSAEHYRALTAMRDRFAEVIAATDHISLMMLPPTMEMTEIEKSDRLLLARLEAFAEPQALEILREVLREHQAHRQQASRAVKAHEIRSTVDDVDHGMTASIPVAADVPTTLALGYASPASARLAALDADERQQPFVELLSEPGSDHSVLPDDGPVPGAKPRSVPDPEPTRAQPAPEKPKKTKTLANMLAYAKPDMPVTTDDGTGGLFSRKSQLPGPGSRIAVYVIDEAVVHMPGGEKLRAHSGRGHMRDNPKYVHVKNQGATPPNVYSLRMRESRFHGIEAIRMTPVGSAPMYNRDGFLTHTFLLRRRGDSSGCVVFEDYNRFLNAFKRGNVKTLVVIPSRRELPKYMAML